MLVDSVGSWNSSTYHAAAEQLCWVLGRRTTSNLEGMMKLPWLKSALEQDGPILSVYLDTTRTDPNAAAELSIRWEQLRTQMVSEGAPTALLDDIHRTVQLPSAIGGRHGRAILASSSQILVDRVLPVPPYQDVARWGDHAVLLPLLQLTPYAVTQLLIEVDRAGADLLLRAPENPAIDQAPNSVAEAESIDGGHDELHKARLGGGSQHGWRSNNYEARVEDSWERNAEAVAEKVNKLVMEHKPDMVILTGDIRALALLKAELGQEALTRLHTAAGGTRGVSLERASFREELARVTQAFIDRNQQNLAEHFREHQARDAASIAGAEEVARALERGQVEELVFTPGREPDNIEHLLRKAILTDAGVSAMQDSYGAIPEGIGALLRWRDGATPSNRAASMTGDPAREDAVDPDRDRALSRDQQASELSR